MIVLLRHITRATACAQCHFWPTQELLQARSHITLQGFCGVSHRHRHRHRPHSSSVCGRAQKYPEQEQVWGTAKMWHTTGEHPLQVRWMSHLVRSLEWIFPAFGNPGMCLLHKNCRTLSNQGDVAYTSRMLQFHVWIPTCVSNGEKTTYREDLPKQLSSQ